MRRAKRPKDGESSTSNIDTEPLSSDPDDPDIVEEVQDDDGDNYNNDVMKTRVRKRSQYAHIVHQGGTGRYILPGDQIPNRFCMRRAPDQAEPQFLQSRLLTQALSRPLCWR